MARERGEQINSIPIPKFWLPGVEQIFDDQRGEKTRCGIGQDQLVAAGSGYGRSISDAASGALYPSGHTSHPEGISNNLLRFSLYLPQM